MKKYLSIFSFVFLIPSALWARQWDERLLQAPRLVYSGNYAQAETMINDYIQESPSDPNGLFVKAVVVEWKGQLAGRPYGETLQNTFDLYKQGNELAWQNWYYDQDNVDKMVDVGNSFLFLGRKYAEKGDWLKAVLVSKKCQKYLEKAFKRDPTRIEGMLAMGGFHYLADSTTGIASSLKGLFGINGSKTQGMAELHRAASGEHPYRYDTLYLLHVLYTNYEKNYDQALQVLNQLEKQFPENPELKMKRANAYEKQDKLKGANAYLGAAAWCEAKTGRCYKSFLFSAYYHSGRIFKELGQNSKAKEFFAKAIPYDAKLEPGFTADLNSFLATAK